METHGLNHLHLNVREIEKSLRFYAAFGFHRIFQHEDIHFVARPGHSDVIALHVSETLGVDHFGFILKDAEQLDAAIAELERSGGRLLERTVLPIGLPSAYVSDPDGYRIQI